MNVYIYQAALICEDCAGYIRQASSYKTLDSWSYPQGPIADGGSEADCPQTCEHCHTFLENPLTDDGVACLVEFLAVRPVTTLQAELQEELLHVYRHELEDHGRAILARKERSHES